MEEVYSDIISDIELTSTSLDSKEAVSCINNAFKNLVISRLHSGMCKKSKLRVYRVERSARSTCVESLSWVLNFYIWNPWSE